MSLFLVGVCSKSPNSKEMYFAVINFMLFDSFYLLVPMLIYSGEKWVYAKAVFKHF